MFANKFILCYTIFCLLISWITAASVRDMKTDSHGVQNQQNSPSVELHKLSGSHLTNPDTLTEVTENKSEVNTVNYSVNKHSTTERARALNENWGQNTQLEYNTTANRSLHINDPLNILQMTDDLKSIKQNTIHTAAVDNFTDNSAKVKKIEDNRQSKVSSDKLPVTSKQRNFDENNIDREVLTPIQSVVMKQYPGTEEVTEVNRVKVESKTSNNSFDKVTGNEISKQFLVQSSQPIEKVTKTQKNKRENDELSLQTDLRTTTKLTSSTLDRKHNVDDYQRKVLQNSNDGLRGIKNKQLNQDLEDDEPNEVGVDRAEPEVLNKTVQGEINMSNPLMEKLESATLNPNIKQKVSDERVPSTDERNGNKTIAIGDQKSNSSLIPHADLKDHSGIKYAKDAMNGMNQVEGANFNSKLKDSAASGENKNLSDAKDISMSDETEDGSVLEEQRYESHKMHSVTERPPQGKSNLTSLPSEGILIDRLNQNLKPEHQDLIRSVLTTAPNNPSKVKQSEKGTEIIERKTSNEIVAKGNLKLEKHHANHEKGKMIEDDIRGKEEKAGERVNKEKTDDRDAEMDAGHRGNNEDGGNKKEDVDKGKKKADDRGKVKAGDRGKEEGEDKGKEEAEDKGKEADDRGKEAGDRDKEVDDRDKEVDDRDKVEAEDRGKKEADDRGKYNGAGDRGNKKEAVDGGNTEDAVDRGRKKADNRGNNEEVLDKSNNKEARNRGKNEKAGDRGKEAAKNEEAGYTRTDDNDKMEKEGNRGKNEMVSSIGREETENADNSEEALHRGNEKEDTGGAEEDIYPDGKDSKLDYKNSGFNLKPPFNKGRYDDSTSLQSASAQQVILYFLYCIFAIIILYLLFHCRTKICVALSEVGKELSAAIKRSSNSDRRSVGSNVAYKKLSTTVDDTLPSIDDKRVAQSYIY